MFVYRKGMTPVKFNHLAHNLKRGETLNLKGGWHVGQKEDEVSPAVFVAIKRLNDGELLILVSSSSAKKALKTYKLRWKIETLFGLLKTKGFNLEDTHMKDAQRLETLFAVLAIAAAIAIKTGRFALQKKPITIKKHGRPAQSIFALGLDILHRFMTWTNYQQIKNMIKRILQPDSDYNSLLHMGVL
jgi:transposase